MYKSIFSELYIDLLIKYNILVTIIITTLGMKKLRHKYLTCEKSLG